VLQAFVEAKLLPMSEVRKQGLFASDDDVSRCSCDGEQVVRTFEPDLFFSCWQIKAGTADPTGISIKYHATAMNSKYRAAAPKADDGKEAKGEAAKKGCAWLRSLASGAVFSHCLSSFCRRNDKAPRVKFDASGVLKQFGSLDLGTVRVPALHLSERKATDPKTQFYRSEALIGLP
jgi:hypothetical protein